MDDVFVITLRPRPGAARPGREEVEAHCRRLADRGGRAELLVAGPFGDEANGGLMVGRFPDRAAAEEFARTDPFVTCGYETCEVRPLEWSRPENGQLGVLPPRPGTSPGFLETLHLRWTARRFADRPLARPLLEDLLRAAAAAPSEFNLQPWRPVVCHSPEDRRRLRAVCLDQPQVEAAGAAVVCAVDPAAFDEDAPRAVDAFVAAGRYPAEERESRLRFVRSCYDTPRKLRDGALRNGVLFGHQLLLAGLSQGLAGFWLGGLDEAALKAALAIPDRVVVTGVVGLGWPAEPEAPQPRRPLDELVSWGSWGGPG